jgi:hypothetical protein
MRSPAQALRERMSPPTHSLWIDTMNRCFPALSSARRRTALLTLALLAFGLSPAAHAQTLTRQFPASALRGKLVVLQPPMVTLDGIAAQLSPGARIRNTNNTLVMSGALVNQEVVVNYQRDGQGLVHEVWILTAVEAAQKRATAADLN